MYKILNLILVVSAALIITSCSSSDSGSSIPVTPPIGDISGGWSIFETNSSVTSECNGTDAYDVTITQTDNAISVTGATSVEVGATGTLSGSSLSLTGSRPFESGTLTYSSITATIPADCSSFEAKTVWSYSEPEGSCTGTGTISANRTSGGTTC